MADRRDYKQLSGLLVLASAVVALEWARAEPGSKGQTQPREMSPLIAGTASSAEGHDADSPAQIPPRGWWSVMRRTIARISENELLAEAAGVTFYGLLSIFPAVTALVSLYGLVADPKTISDHLDLLTGIIPGGGMDIITEQIKRLTENPAGKLGIGAIIGTATAIWSANQASKALFSALNVVYGEKETRGFVKLTAQTLAFTLGGLIFVLIALAAVVVLPAVFAFVGFPAGKGDALALLRWPLVLIVTVFFLACLYRFGPNRAQPKWRWVTWGGVVAALGWVALSGGFSWYVEHFGSYNKTYGSLGAVIGFMTWIWLSTTIMLVGAQLNAEAELQTRRDSTTGPEKPPGGRGAQKADHVA